MPGTTATMNCIRCRSEIDSDADFCNECGARQGPSKPPIDRGCPACGAGVSMSDKFCKSCSFNLYGEERPPERENSSIRSTPREIYPSPTEPFRQERSGGSAFGDPGGSRRSDGSEPPILFSFAGPTMSVPVFSGPAAAVMNRYNDGYMVARTLDGFGKTLKVLGAIMGGGIIFFGFIIGSSFASAASMMGSTGSGAGSFLFFLFTFGVWGGIVGVVFWVMGILISAQGQVLKAQLDGAVHTSPFLSDPEKAQVMSLPVPQSTSRS
jgi:hypothetical protein